MSVKIETRPRTKIEREIRQGMMEVFPHARPGMKIYCEDYIFPAEGVVTPRLQNVYTIRELRRGLWKTWAVGFTLREIVNEIDSERGSEPFFSADAFVLLTDEEAERLEVPR